jgi:hypothetical protein
MTENAADGVEDCGARLHGTLMPLQLPFDPNRAYKLMAEPFLCMVFMVCRYHWSERGVCTYLTSSEQNAIAIVNWAAWNETTERRSDDLAGISPIIRNRAALVTAQGVTRP